MDELLSIAELADIIGITEQAIYKRIKKNRSSRISAGSFY